MTRLAIIFLMAALSGCALPPQKIEKNLPRMSILYTYYKDTPDLIHACEQYGKDCTDPTVKSFVYQGLTFCNIHILYPNSYDYELRFVTHWTWDIINRREIRICREIAANLPVAE